MANNVYVRCTQCHFAKSYRVRSLVGICGERRLADRDRLLVSSIGLATLQAIDNHDYALLQGAFLVISVAVLAANFLADFLYVLLDPRVRLGGN